MGGRITRIRLSGCEESWVAGSTAAEWHTVVRLGRYNRHGTHASIANSQSVSIPDVHSPHTVFVRVSGEPGLSDGVPLAPIHDFRHTEHHLWFGCNVSI